MLLYIKAASAQQPAPGRMSLQAPSNVPPPNPKGSEPRPEPAEVALLAAFDSYEVVGMGAAHGNKDLDDFILRLIRNPAFASKVNVVAVECGNSLYQPVLDRYTAGADMPLAEVRQVWRNTTQPMCGLSGFYEELFPLIRRINQTLAPEKKLRVVACDPPIDWSKVRSRQDFGHGQFLTRDPTIAAVMEKEVLSKHLKALMLFGTAHLFHEPGASGGLPDTAVGIYEKDYPGVTLVVADHTGFGNWTPQEKYNAEFEKRMTAWPVPSLVGHMNGTWLADLLDTTYSSGDILFGVADSGKIPSGAAPVKGTFAEIPAGTDAKFSKKVDAYLYLGPRDLLLNEPVPAEIVLDKAYMAELERRSDIMGIAAAVDDGNPENISGRDANPFFYDPDELQKFLMPFGPMAPGGKTPAGQKMPLGGPED